MNVLMQIQQELKAPKVQFNKFGKYNYRSLEDIMEAVKPLLKKHNCTLEFTDMTSEIAGIPVVTATAILRDSNGLELAGVNAQAGVDVDRKGMDISQSFGASSSYARKYAANGLFLIDDTKDADATNDHGKKPIEKKGLLTKASNNWAKAVEYVASQENKEAAISKLQEQYEIGKSDLAELKK